MKLAARFGLASLLVASTFTAWAVAEDKPTTRPYPMDTCVVSGEKLGGEMGEMVVYSHEGREIRFCCSMCVADFKKDPAKYLAKLDAAAATQPATKPAK